MPITGQIDWGGIAFGASLPTGMCWLIGNDGQHYAVASSGNPWTPGCAETNALLSTIDQTQWRVDLASLAMGTSGTYTMATNVPVTGTKQFFILGFKSTGIVADVVGVRYNILSPLSVTIDGGFFYKSNLTANDCIPLMTLPVMGASTAIGGFVYAVCRLSNDHIIGPTLPSVIMKLPLTGTVVDTTPGSWAGQVGGMPWVVQPASTGQQYGGFAGIIPDPAGIRVYSYVSGGIVAANGGNFNGITTSGMISTVFNSGLANSGVNNVSSQFGMPFPDDGLNYAGAVGTTRDYNVTPSISPDGTRITFARTFSDNEQQGRIRRFSFNPSTGAVSSLGVLETPYTTTPTSGVPEWVQPFEQGRTLIFAGRDTHRLLLGNYTFPPALTYVSMIGPIRAGSGVAPTPSVSSSYFGGEFDSYFGDYLR